MKKVIPLIALLTLFFSCSKPETQSAEERHHIEGARQVVQNFNGGKLPHERAELIEGRVYVRALEDNIIQVLVENNAKNKHIYYALQMEETLDQYKGWEIYMKKAQILFFRESLVVNSLEEKKRLLFKLTGSTLPDFGNDLVYDDLFEGYGLSRAQRTVNDQEVSLRTLVGEPIPVSCRCRVSASDFSDCDAGGAGATGCSISNGNDSCSVSCSADLDLNACCKD